MLSFVTRSSKATRLIGQMNIPLKSWSRQTAKFGSHSNSGSGDMFLVYDKISQDHVFNGSCDFVGRSP